MRSVHILSACNHGEVHTRHVCEVFLELLGAVTTHACWFQCQFPSTYKQKIEMWLTIKMYQHVGIRFSMLFLTFFDNDRFCSGWVWNSKIFFFFFSMLDLWLQIMSSKFATICEGENQPGNIHPWRVKSMVSCTATLVPDAIHGRVKKGKKHYRRL